MMRRHAVVLLLVAVFAALAVWLHSCDGASETRTGATPPGIAPPRDRSDAGAGLTNRAASAWAENRRSRRGATWIWQRTG
jgi:hypothetical protein